MEDSVGLSGKSEPMTWKLVEATAAAFSNCAAMSAETLYALLIDSRFAQSQLRGHPKVCVFLALLNKEGGGFTIIQ